MTFWGPPQRLGLLPYFMKVFELSPPDHTAASMRQSETGRRGVVEAMFDSAGFEFVERGSIDVVAEFPELETAVRAMAAAGPSVPAIAQVGYEGFLDALRPVFAPMVDEQLGLRIRSQFEWATAKKAK